MNLVPFSFTATPELPSSELAPVEPGTRQGVHFTIEADQRQWFFDKIDAWFAKRLEVVIVDTGISDKQGVGYVLLEWIDCQVDRLFIDILRSEEMVIDFTVYTRVEVL